MGATAQFLFPRLRLCSLFCRPSVFLCSCFLFGPLISAFLTPAHPTALSRFTILLDWSPRHHMSAHPPARTTKTKGTGHNCCQLPLVFVPCCPCVQFHGLGHTQIRILREPRRTKTVRDEGSGLGVPDGWCYSTPGPCLLFAAWPCSPPKRAQHFLFDKLSGCFYCCRPPRQTGGPSSLT